MYKDIIFRKYDIRGRFQTDFDEEFAFDLGQAVCEYLKTNLNNNSPRITVGHDMRLSSPELTERLIQGLLSCGAHVIQLGMISTPVSYFSTFHMEDISGSIMVTASHNPKEYNGFKISYQNQPLFDEKIQDLKNYFYKPNLLSGTLSKYEILPEYIEHTSVKQFQNLDSIPIILDCGNGAVGTSVRALYEKAGAHIKEILYEEPDGNFPNHHPDPTIKENLEVLINKVKLSQEPIIGIAFDGDGDRIGVVDESGHLLYIDELLSIFSKYVLKNYPQAPIVADVKCSNVLFQSITRNGGQPVMCQTGHSFIKNKILEIDSPFGGEFSGHIFFNDRNYGYDDAAYAGLRLLEILKEEKASLSDLVAKEPKNFRTREIRLPLTSQQKEKFVQTTLPMLQSKEMIEKLNYTATTIDGIRITFKDGWALLRLSQTESLITIRAEAETAERLNQIISYVQTWTEKKW